MSKSVGVFCFKNIIDPGLHSGSPSHIYRNVVFDKPLIRLENSVFPFPFKTIIIIIPYHVSGWRACNSA